MKMWRSSGAIVAQLIELRHSKWRGFSAALRQAGFVPHP
jgi:hypothetical protein